LGAAAELIQSIEVQRIDMKGRKTIKTRRAEAGIALLISIFVLLLISAVAIGLDWFLRTESALAGNYRSSTGVYTPALSGLEEARGRLLAKNPMLFQDTDGKLSACTRNHSAHGLSLRSEPRPYGSHGRHPHDVSRYGIRQ